MPRLTITITDEQAELLDEKTGDGGEYESKSAAVRDFIDRGEDAEERIAELEQTVERLQNEKQALVDRHQQTTEIEKYREDRHLLEESSLSDRLRWLLFGQYK